MGSCNLPFFCYPPPPRHAPYVGFCILCVLYYTVCLWPPCLPPLSPFPMPIFLVYPLHPRSPRRHARLDAMHWWGMRACDHERGVRHWLSGHRGLEFTANYATHRKPLAVAAHACCCE